MRSDPAALWHRLPKDFERQLDWAVDQGFNAFHFDDGYDDVLRAADALDERHLVGTFFIVPGWLGLEGHTTFSDVRELEKRGHVIGNHTAHHVWMPKVSPVVQAHEWELAELLLWGQGIRQETFPRAWPYGLAGIGEARGISPREVRPFR